MRLDRKSLLLYGVTDRKWLKGRTLTEVVKESLEGGATMIQLREKNLEEGRFLEEAKELLSENGVILRHDVNRGKGAALKTAFK